MSYIFKRLGIHCDNIVMMKEEWNEMKMFLPHIHGIGKNCFTGNNSIKSLTVPTTIDKLLPEAFQQCPFLTYLSIPSTVTSIGENCFSFNYNLQQIDFNANVTELRHDLFHYCKMTSFTIPTTIKKISENAFYGCTFLESISIPSSVTEIEESVFQSLYKLTSFTFEENCQLTEIPLFVCFDCQMSECVSFVF